MSPENRIALCVVIGLIIGSVASLVIEWFVFGPGGTYWR